MGKGLPAVVFITVASVLSAASGYVGAASPQQPLAAAADTAAPRATLDKYCVRCHNDRLKTGELSLQTIDVAKVAEHPQVWEKVIRKLRANAMPPAGAPHPDEPVLANMAAHFESEIDRAAAARPNPGRTQPLHRLNRAEYQNAIRDLLALDINAAETIPADDQSYGFDNIAGVTKLSPTLLERYMGAAREISRLAVGASPIPPTSETFRLRSDLGQYRRMEGLPFGTRGGASVSYNFPKDGEYEFSLELVDLFAGAPVREPHDLELSVDGERVKVFRLQPQGAPTIAAYMTVEKGMKVRAPIKAGPRTVIAAFVKKTDALAESVRQPFDRPHGEGDNLMYAPHLGTITISGPFSASKAGDTPSRKRIFICSPVSAAQEAECAKRILGTLGRRAYRRPVSDADVQDLFTYYQEGRAAGASFESGIERSLRALLVKPEFLFRVTADPVGVRPGTVYRLTDLEVASRLSFFLWSTIPDEELLTVAAQGKLKTPAVLEQQVRRMLKDPRSSALAANFAGQWLRLRNLAQALPDDVIFPNFSDNLRRDFAKETELLFQSIVQEDRSSIDLLTADYTFVNERLAKHYGIPNVYGSEFRRVTIPDVNRRGLLGQGSILTVTSYSDRTSAVGRGKWILENVLGTPPPPPPPNVPALAETESISGKSLSMRERMVKHRANPVCASCHSLMDPLGFALENFDAVGRWRSRGEGGSAIDASGTMPNGTKFNGVVELRPLLTKSSEQFVTVMTEKLLIYALGRGIEFSDAPAIRQIVRGAATSNYKFGALVVGLAKSVPFQMRSAPSEPVKTVASR